MIKVGDKIEVDETVRGRVLTSSSMGADGFGFLDYKILSPKSEAQKYPHGKYIGISPLGNPRVKVVKRSKGRILPHKEWE